MLSNEELKKELIKLKICGKDCPTTKWEQIRDWFRLSSYGGASRGSRNEYSGVEK